MGVALKRLISRWVASRETSARVAEQGDGWLKRKWVTTSVRWMAKQRDWWLRREMDG